VIKKQCIAVKGLTSNTNRNIADYYNQTLNHYQMWWKLDRSLAVHYGLWDTRTKNFREALKNTNKFLMDTAEVKEGSRILDAGCGVGGSAFYLAEEKKAKVTGITLSEKQLEYAIRKSKELNLTELVNFRLEDYLRTSFAPETFDLVWAIESVTSAPDKQKFAREVYRVLKPGGKLIVADYFKPGKDIEDPKNWLKKWQDCWSLADFMTVTNYAVVFDHEGLTFSKKGNVTANILPSARYMYRSYLLGALPSMVYNFFNHTSHYAKTHYKSGKYQYKALKEGLWEYWVLLFEKQKRDSGTNPGSLKPAAPSLHQTDDPLAITPGRVYVKDIHLS
jgi:ubiquinone/menaquinone biosynthesis C-methylase UbiE